MLGFFIIMLAVPAIVALGCLGCRLSTRDWTEADWERAYAGQRRIAATQGA
jgi:hypothetical protein